MDESFLRRQTEEDNLEERDEEAERPGRCIAGYATNHAHDCLAYPITPSPACDAE